MKINIPIPWILWDRYSPENYVDLDSTQKTNEQENQHSEPTCIFWIHFRFAVKMIGVCACVCLCVARRIQTLNGDLELIRILVGTNKTNKQTTDKI